MLKTLKNKKGFTLIELIIVIAIIAILAAIMIPVYGTFRENAVRRAANVMGRNLVMGYEVVLTETGTRPANEAALCGAVSAGVTTAAGLDPNASGLSVSDTGFVFTYANSGFTFTVTYNRATSSNVTITP